MNSVKIEKGEKVALGLTKEGMEKWETTYDICGKIVHVSCTTILLETTSYYVKTSTGYEQRPGGTINIPFTDIRRVLPR